MNITVITASLPSRTGMLMEAVHSVNNQTLLPVEHLVGIDHKREGSAAVRNKLLGAASSSWVAFLDDDDLLYPHHLSSLRAAAISENADLVYSASDGYDPAAPFDPERLMNGHNMIPVTVLVRTKLLWDVGGFAAGAPNGWEDHGAWVKLHKAGCRFHYLPDKTWVYRLHPGSKTHRGDEAY